MCLWESSRVCCVCVYVRVSAQGPGAYLRLRQMFVWSGQRGSVKGAGESPVLSERSAAVRWLPTHGRYQGIQGLKVKWDHVCVRVCVYLTPTPSHGAVLGPMSLMQFWTKLYSQLGRPLPKVLILFCSICHVLYESYLCNRLFLLLLLLFLLFAKFFWTSGGYVFGKSFYYSPLGSVFIRLQSSLWLMLFCYIYFTSWQEYWKYFRVITVLKLPAQALY